MSNAPIVEGAGANVFAGVLMFQEDAQRTLGQQARLGWVCSKSFVRRRQPLLTWIIVFDLLDCFRRYETANGFATDGICVEPRQTEDPAEV